MTNLWATKTNRMPHFFPWIAAVLIGLATIHQIASATAADAVPIPHISTFAPADDLIAQVDFFLGRIEQSLANKADFDGAKQSRTWKDANTLAALSLMLAVHDQPHPLRASAATMLAASEQLAAAAENYDQARAALERLRAARAGGAPEAAPAKWEKAASLGALMKQVPLVHTALKRGVERGRLARQSAAAAGQAAALAAIAQAAMLDNEQVRQPDEESQWRLYCAQMRDAAGEINSAVHAGDEGRVAEGMKRLAQSCETCHAKFRRP
jgi:cytochrome c556